MISYLYPGSVEAKWIDDRPTLTTEQGGFVAIDAYLLALWEFAGGKTYEQIVDKFQVDGYPEDEIGASLACLVEAGLLLRDAESQTTAIHFTKVAGPLVSIVIVGYNSLDWLAGCLESASCQTYESIELVFVDNGSIDGSQVWLQSNYPDAKLIRIDEPVAFAKAINIGAEAASGDYFFFLNPDTVLDPRAVSEMVEIAQSNPECAAVGAKLKLLWAPSFINGIGNRVDAFSWGVDNGLGHLDIGQFDSWLEIPSVCFAAALIPRDIWKKVGPADERIPMYYEDSEWSYRARKLGYSILAAPQAVIQHAFGGRIPGKNSESMNSQKMINVVYGRLRFAAKLLDAYMAEFILSYMFSDLLNFLRNLITMKIGLSAAILRGYVKFLLDLPEIWGQHKDLTRRAVVSDKALFRTQRDFPETIIWHSFPELTWDLVRNYYLPEIANQKTCEMVEISHQKNQPKLLIISHDVIDEKLAGPGMRYMELGRTLGKYFPVTIAVPGESRIDVPNVTIQPYSENQPKKLEDLADSNDIVLVSSYLVNRFPFIEESRSKIVVDLYDPFVLENLHYYFDEPLDAQINLNQQSVAITNQLAQVGDFFICGNERQRDYWLGVLTSNGRVNPQNYLNDSQLRSLIDVVGIGYPEQPPKQSKLLRGIHPSIPDEAKIILWGGGVWNWLDPITLINAWPAVIQRHPEARLVFLGTRHPNPDIPPHKMAEDAQLLADEISAKDKSILFIEWLSYEDREALLREADVGVSLHPIHIETRYSIRTRMLDYIWARLPILSSEGDITSEWIQDYGFGEVVPAGDSNAVAQALIAMLDISKEAWQEKFDAFGDDYHWDNVAAPLRDYCINGDYAADRVDRQKGEFRKPGSSQKWELNWARARFIYHSEGWRGLLHRTWRYLQRKLASW